MLAFISLERLNLIMSNTDDDQRRAVLNALSEAQRRPVDKDKLIQGFAQQYHIDAQYKLRMRQGLNVYLESIETMLDYVDALRTAKRRKDADEALAILDQFIGNYKELNDALTNAESSNK